jgi:hypothetical protein
MAKMDSETLSKNDSTVSTANADVKHYPRLARQFEALSHKLAAKWNSDPTVVASFLSAFNSLLESIEAGETPYSHAYDILRGEYEEHLPAEGAADTDSPVHIPSEGARPVPGHGQFYKAVRPGVWQAIDYTESNEADAPPTRRIWLTYTRGSARQRE